MTGDWPPFATALVAAGFQDILPFDPTAISVPGPLPDILALPTVPTGFVFHLPVLSINNDAPVKFPGDDEPIPMVNSPEHIVHLDILLGIHAGVQIGAAANCCFCSFIGIDLDGPASAGGDLHVF